MLENCIVGARIYLQLPSLLSHHHVGLSANARGIDAGQDRPGHVVLLLTVLSESTGQQNRMLLQKASLAYEGFDKLPRSPVPSMRFWMKRFFPDRRCSIKVIDLQIARKEEKVVEKGH